MKSIAKIVLSSGVLVAALSLAPKQAHAADECLEAGLRDKDGGWQWYRAWVDAQDGNRVHIKYDHHHGELELKVFEKEKGDGEDVIVMKGRWFEGRDGQRSGKVRLEMEKGHHHARGWYAFGDGEDSPHLDFQLRDCKR